MNIIKYSFALLVLASGIALGANNNAPSNKNIVETAVEAGSFKTLAAALQAGDLIDALSGDTEFTVFAPTDEAFAKLPKGTLESLLKPENKDKLVAILKYHVVKGRVTSKKVVKLNEATTIGGKTVKISTSKGVMVNNAKVVKVDINCKNGVIHVIDTVLIP
jgi:transforming growth factor-beta-induced protein